jgi:geranylgeranyl pyrophosphate synthase
MAVLGARGSADPVEGILALGGGALRRRMARAESELVTLVGEGGGVLALQAADTISAGGKRLRPLLVFIAGHGNGGGDGDAGDELLVRAAVAIELIHSATLVHDDVLDGAPLRRGRPTVYALAGREAATATGDLLFSRAFGELALNDSAEQLRVLSVASSALAQGELIQREDAWRADVSVERYLYRCELKTARLFEAACALGVLAAGVERRLDGFGRAIGLAFQILDDVLDVSGPAERTGKQRGADLLDGTVTLPLIVARQRDPELAALDLRTIEEPEPVCERIAETGAIEHSRAMALELVAEAKAALPADLGARGRRALELVADGVVERYS